MSSSVSSRKGQAVGRHEKANGADEHRRYRTSRTVESEGSRDQARHAAKLNELGGAVTAKEGEMASMRAEVGSCRGCGGAKEGNVTAGPAGCHCC